MKTFEEDLKPEITPEFIKQCVELAEGFELDDDGEFIDGIICPDGCEYEFEDIIKIEIIFPLLIHRAVEGFNNKNGSMISTHKDAIVFFTDGNKEYKDYPYEDYQSCHLTACEMAILDCLIEVLK